MNILTRSVLALTMVTSCLFAGIGPAHAEEPKTQTRMEDYSTGAVWQTSTKWGRVRHRGGFEWTLSEPFQVRAVDQFELDWPTNCTVGGSVSKNPGISVSGCTPKLATKAFELDFHSITMPIRWAGPGGEGSKTCKFGSTGTEWTDFHETWKCAGDWMPLEDDYRYSMSTDSITADVRDDGDGLKTLPGSQSSVTFTQR
jgi:hypothetical protein